MQFTLPDLFASCPFPSAYNPHHREAGAESRAWLESYNMFSNKKKIYIVSGQNELLVAHAYPFAGREQFRTICDFVNLLFVVDEVSDDQNAADARVTGLVFLNVMHNNIEPHSIVGSELARLAQMTYDFRTRFLKHVGPQSAKRFLIHCQHYIDAVIKEAELREHSQVLPLEPYIHLRRENSAIRLCFGLFEMALGIDLPDTVFRDPVFAQVYFAAADHVCWANDVYSYAMEITKGHMGNNIVTVLIKDKGVSLQEAADLVGMHCKKLVTQFIANSHKLSFDSIVDHQVRLYISAMSSWMRGNLDWSFESHRYFGPNHNQVRKDRIVRFVPMSDGVVVNKCDPDSE